MGNRPSGRSADNTFVTAPVADGVTRICVAGGDISPFVGRARKIASQIAHSHPTQYETWFKIGGDVGFHDFTKQKFDPVPFPEHLKGHGSMPFCWLERGENAEIEPIGGCDHLTAWARANFPNEPAIQNLLIDGYEGGDVCHNGCSAFCFCFACCCEPFAPQTSEF